MEYISAKEIAEKWGITQRRVAVLCSEGRIPDAKMVGHMWIIPSTAKKPLDARTTRHIKSENNQVRPFVKWAGGKGQLVREIGEYYPFRNKQIIKYAEPFIGGGAVLFDILNKYCLEEIYISDINDRLINTYLIIRDHIEELIEWLTELQHEFISLETIQRKEYYNQKRDRFNNLKREKNIEESIEEAALMIFLNRTCFNGLYRVNKKGEFNVPMGGYKNPLICDKENLTAVSRKLQGVKIVCGDYQESEKFIDNNTFVYIDPPYRPLTRTASFTAYTESLFDDEDQQTLASFVSKISKKGAKIVISNSDPKNIDKDDDFFDDMYKNYKIKRVKAKRNINSNGSGRGEITELLITNYEI